MRYLCSLLLLTFACGGGKTPNGDSAVAGEVHTPGSDYPLDGEGRVLDSDSSDEGHMLDGSSALNGEVRILDADSAFDTGPSVDLSIGTLECMVDSDCAAAHTFCGDQITTRTCECVAGYKPGVAGACEWAGVIADPGFQSTNHWTLGPDVTIDLNQPLDAGYYDPGVVRDPGVLRFEKNGICGLQRATQVIEMPKLSRAEPLVVVTTYQFLAGDPSDSVELALGIGTVWHTEGLMQFGKQVSPHGFQTTRFCLGSSQYAPEATKGKGAPIDVVLMPTSDTSRCTGSLQIDHIEIKPANPDECPLPGTAVNGDAEGTGGWEFNVSVDPVSKPDNSTAKIEAGVGEANTHGARLFLNQPCGISLGLTNSISIPDAGTIASPAISVFNRTSRDVEVDWRLGNVWLPPIMGTGQSAIVKMCVPAFMRGGVFTLSARLYGLGPCMGAPLNFESTFDNLEVVNDPSCGTDEMTTDLGFESSLPLVGTDAENNSVVRVLNDPTNAHSGSGVLQISATQTCQSPSWVANVVTPPSVAGAGPVLSFFYKATPASYYTFSVRGLYRSRGGAFAATLDNQCHAGKTCLDPGLVGRNIRVSFSLDLVKVWNGSCAATAIPAETAFVDDLQVTTDPDCPAL
jgi:hypothetical protein